jgi:uncharacterized damage-inducible protein DinB
VECHRIHLFSQPIVMLLQQLALVVDALDDGQYVQKPVGVVNSSVGGHVRHCLEHVRALITAADSGFLDYDQRVRGTPVESSRTAACREIDQLIRGLQMLPADSETMRITLMVLMNSGGESLPVETTLGRELAYSLSHTIHHNALIAAMVKTLRGWLPDRFGYAPSTVKHLEATPCAR